MVTILVLGASGTVGSKVIRHLHESASHLNDFSVKVRLASSRPETASKWRDEGHDAIVLDLNQPDTFADALAGVDRIFLLTTYSASMLYQSKMLIDAAVVANVGHLVHLGVMTSGRDHIPHFAWHDLIESYIKQSGIAWTHLHPNVIFDAVLLSDPPLAQTRNFSVFWGDAPLG